MKLWGPLARAAAPGASHSHAGPQSGFCSSLKLPFQCSHQFTGAPVHAAPAAWLQACRPLCDPPGAGSKKGIATQTSLFVLAAPDLRWQVYPVTLVL